MSYCELYVIGLIMYHNYEYLIIAIKAVLLWITCNRLMCKHYYIYNIMCHNYEYIIIAIKYVNYAL